MRKGRSPHSIDHCFPPVCILQGISNSTSCTLGNKLLPLKQNKKNLRLVDAAVVEDKVNAGKLLPRLFRLQIQLYNASVTCGVTKHCVTIAFLLVQSSNISIKYNRCYLIKSVYEYVSGPSPGKTFGNVNCLILGVTCQFLYS